jgi:hypothetical protein
MGFSNLLSRRKGGEKSPPFLFGKDARHVTITLNPLAISLSLLYSCLVKE